MKFTIRAIFIILILSALLFSAHGGAEVNHSAFSLVKECLACHPRALPTHKQNTVEEMAGDLPLGPGGIMLCLTCHNCTSQGCQLRKEPVELCQACHDCGQGMACVMRIAHLGDSGERLDDYCSTCHDGTLFEDEVGGGDHKVDVAYVTNEDFRHIADKRVVLFEGKVTCLSCHNPYASDSARLIKSNADSKLCLTCHIK